MAHPAHTSLKSAPVRPHVHIGASRTKLYLPRGSRNQAPESWTRAYPGPIKAEWRALAQYKGFDLVRRIRDKSHVALRCHTCGALTAQKLFTLRTAQPACAGCRHRAVLAIAQKAGLAFQGYDPEYHKLGIYHAPCGHTVRRQFGQIERIANGHCKLRCETCHSGKEAEEAADRGWQLQGSDPEGNPNYRIYRHGCGHRQRVARANMQSGRFQCTACGEGWATAPSNLYAIRMELPTGLKVVKLGFSRDPQSRLRHQLLLQPGIQAELLQTVPQPTGHTALCCEKALNRALKKSHPDAIIPHAQFQDWLSVKTEVYGIEIEPLILTRLNEIR
ncbi:GIY-YIG nuclease family protein [Rhodovulum sulfidophilum]|uniref:GIY-YIG nuclease family protein n=1 Tax=Rhodovulum sulfidophilum TaxID=35806 RepID=A0ABS1RU38_RHOSU|nr:GIY-YIG nuclease family protein [Rhodovulum sulfidophilum]MBL3609158.1 GIY-YIG nuclease family protein [Rhodovulum sulfidophilum]